MAEGETKGMVDLEKELSCSVSAFWFIRFGGAVEAVNDGRHRLCHKRRLRRDTIIHEFYDVDVTLRWIGLLYQIQDPLC